MDIYNPINSTGPLSSVPNSSGFHDDDYMEYKRRVFAELAADYQVNKAENNSNKNCQQAGNNLFSSTQPSWDDSDLLEETYAIQAQNSSKSLHPQTNLSNSSSKSEQFSSLITENKPLIDWSAIDAHINQIDNRSNSFDSLSIAKSKANNTESLNPTWNGKKSAFQSFTAKGSTTSTLHDSTNTDTKISEQKLSREAIRRKLSLGESDEEDFTSDKSWAKFSPNSESLHICYINNSCSSDSEQESANVRNSTSSFSPISSPSFTASRMLAKKYARSKLPSDPSLHSSSSSNSSVKSENSLLRRIEGASPSQKGELSDREMEVRFELAQAQQRAKQQAADERRVERLTSRASLAHRLLSDTLPEDTATKMKSYSLTREHCNVMTVGQLQLILNDMHAKKQALNEKLVYLLIARDELHTEQDAKLVDIEDAKSMLDAAGPETTV